MVEALRRRWRLLLSGLILIWLVLAAVALISARRDIGAGLRAIETARDRADATALVEGDLLPDLRVARSQFAAAHDRVDGPLLAPARILPFFGRQLGSVRALSDAATSVAHIAVAGMTDARPILDEPGGTHAARADSARRLGQLAGGADARLGRLDLGPRAGLLPPLTRARNQLAGEVAELRDALGKAAMAGEAVAGLLGGPRRYLVFAANNAEMRAGSGMLLSAGELETGSGGLRLSAMRSVTDIPVPPGAVPVTGDLAERWGWLEPSVEWRNLMTSPRFDTAAPLAARMWEAAGNRPVDGVMVLDPVALAALLRATGPVEVEGRWFDQDNIEDELLHDQYLRFSALEERPERREGLGRIAAAVFSSLDSGRWSLPGLATGMARAAGGRHLLLWASDEGEQSAWRALGVDGSLGPDSLMVSVLNRGGNKLDPFLQVRADISLAPRGDETEVILSISLENRVPPGEPTYIAGPHPLSGVGEGVYVGILVVNMPASASGGRFDGIEELVVAGPDGPSQAIGFQFDLDRGRERTVVTRFRMPTQFPTLRAEPSARVPATGWRSGDAAWTDASEKVLTRRR